MLYILTKEELDALKGGDDREDKTEEIRTEWLKAISKHLEDRPITIDFNEDPRAALGRWLVGACNFAETILNPEPPDNIIKLPV